MIESSKQGIIHTDYEVNENAGFIVSPVYKSHLTIHDGFRVNLTTKMPNPWHRFWCWALLGWKWHEDENKE